MKTDICHSCVFRTLTLYALAILHASLATGAPTDPELNPNSDAGTPVRRVLVPVDKPEVWPTQGQRYLPIELARLAPLLESSAQADARPVELKIEARYSSSGRLIGEGHLRIKAPRPGFLPWPLSPIEIANLRWQTSGRAAFGWWPTAGAGQLGLVVPRNDELQFELRTPSVDWIGTRGCLTLALPSALRRTLLLNTPDWLRVSGESLIIQSAPVPADAEGRLWQIEAPPGAPLVLSFTDSRTQEAGPAERFSVVEATRIHLLPQGAAVTTQFELSSPRPLPDRLRVALPTGTVLEQACFAGAQVGIRPLSATEAGIDGNTNVVELELPEGHGVKNDTLELDGWAAVPIDQDWVAARPRLLDVGWSAGRLDVSLTEGMTLVDVTLQQDAVAIVPEVEAVLAEADEVANKAAAEMGKQRIAYQLTSPDASVMLRVRPVSSELQATVRRECLFSDTNLKVDTTLIPEQVVGEAPTALRFEVLSGWRVTSVESTPAGMLDRWEVEPGGERSSVRLSLGSNATAATLPGTRFVVHAQRDGRPTFGKHESLLELRAVDARDIQTLSDQITLRAAESQTFRLWNLKTSRLVAVNPPTAEQASESEADEPSLSTTIEQLVTSGVNSLRVDLTGLDRAALASAGVEMQKRLAAFSANITIGVRPPANGDAGIDCDLTVEFSRRRPAKASVVVRFDTPLPPNVTWAGGEGRQPLLVEPADEATARGEGFRWRVRPASGDAWAGFTVSATLSAADRWRLPLPTIERAASQRNQLVVAGELVTAGWIEGAGLRPLPPPVGVPPDTIAFAYASRGASGGIELLGTTPGPPRSTAVLRSITSRYAPDGVARHAAVYASLRLGTDLTVRLPEGAQFTSVEDADGQFLACEQTSEELIVLPARRLKNTGSVTIHYTTEAGHPGHGRTLHSEPPLTPEPPAVWTWRVELPPGRGLAGFNSKGARQAMSWTERLLGLFASANWGEAKNSTSTTAWSTYVITAGTAGTTRLSIVAPRQAVRLAIGILFVGVFAGALLSNRPRLALLAIGLALSAALVLPESLAPLAASAWLGLLLSFPLGLVIDRAREWKSISGAAMLEHQTTATQRTLMLLTACSLAGPAYAQPAPQSAAPETVLMPVDERFQPVGDKVYVREGLLTRLLAAEARRDLAEPSEVLVRSAEYRGRLTRATNGALGPRDWTMQFELTTFSRSAKVWLPLQRDQAEWPAAAIVDGEPRPLRWNTAGNACWFDVDQPGDARAVISFRPTVIIADSESCLQLGLPPLSDARLMVEFPPDLSNLRAPLAQPTVRRRPDEGRLTASLASQPELLLCWTNKPSEPTPEPTPINLLQWLRVTPLGVDLHVRAQADEAGESLQNVRFETPHGAAAVELQRQGVVGADESDEDTSDENLTTKQAVFRLVRSTPLGVIRPPLVKVANGEIRSRALGVSVDETLEWSLTTGSQTRSLDAGEFSDRWSLLGGEPPNVDRAMLLKGKSLPKISVRPAHRSVLLSQQLGLRVDRQRTACEYQADFDAKRPLATQYAFRVPRRLAVLDVACSMDGREVASRWTRPVADRVVVFVDDSASGPLRVRLTAEMPHEQGEVVVPVVRFWDESANLDVVLARDRTVLVEPLGVAWETSVASGVNDRATLPVATQTSRPGTPAPAFLVHPNPARFKVETLTRFQSTDAGARLTMLSSVDISDGEVWRLPVAIAPGVESPNVEEPAGALLERADRVGAAGWQLVLPEPRQPDEPLLVRIVAKAAPSAIESLPVAPLRIVGPIARRPLVAINSDDDELGGRWDLAALRRIDAPAWLLDAEPDARRWQLYQPPGNGSRRVIAWVTNDTPQTNLIQVTRRDTRALIGLDGEATIATQFTVEPRGTRVCQIRLSPGHRLLTTRVDGAPALCRFADEPDTWIVTLRSTRQAGNIELLTSGPIDGTLLPAQLVNRAGEPCVPVESLYEIGMPADATLAAGSGLTPIDIGNLAATRQNTVAPSLSAAPVTGVDDPPGVSPLLAGCEQQLAFLAEGSHVPPTVVTGQILPSVGRWAAAVLILAATLAGVARRAVG